MTCPLEDFLKSDMGADGLDGCLDNFGTLLFGAGRDHFGRPSQDFAQKSGRERLCFLSFRIISSHTFVYVDVAIRAGFAANADMRFSSERASHKHPQ